MDIKERLQDYIELNKEIDYQIIRLEHYSEKIKSIKSPLYSDMPKAPPIHPDHIADMISRKEEIEKNIRDLMQQREKKRQIINRLIARLSKPELKIVLQLRYINLKEWNEVIFDMYGEKEDYEMKLDNYRQRVFRYHKQAITEIEKMTVEEVRT